MQPRNEYERQVADAARTLRPLTAKQLKWAADRCVTRYGRRTKKGVITCVECGHTWTDKTAQGYCICPACHTRLTLYLSIRVCRYSASSMWPITYG